MLRRLLQYHHEIIPTYMRNALEYGILIYSTVT